MIQHLQRLLPYVLVFLSLIIFGAFVLIFTLTHPKQVFASNPRQVPYQIATPTLASIPTVSPTSYLPRIPSQISDPLPRLSITVVNEDDFPPQLRIVDSETNTPVYVTSTLHYLPQHRVAQTSRLLQKRTPTDDSWELLLAENFEEAFPASNCEVFGSNVPNNHYWGADSFKSFNGSKAGWSARNGANGLDPSSNNYPLTNTVG
jgi:hypothetical protein